MALKKVASSPTEASIAIDQYANIFCEKKLLFGSIEARSSALRGQTKADFQNLQQHKEVDPCSMMMDVALFDEENPIMDWLSNSMTESAPILDEYDDYDDDWTTPGGFLIDELQMQPEEVAAFKRKLYFGRNGGQKKGNVGLDDEEEFVDDYESDSAHGSPVYAETGDSSSASEEDGDGADDVGGDQSGGGIAFGEVAKKHGAGSSGRRVRGGGAACRSGVTIGRPSCFIRPRSTRKKKSTLKAVFEL
ncbi:uncharacterized protein LOC120653665 [Panicum virgatum]|uniref:uncharacterized protein LOC120653665 n=1 Tax=Panicum virgatum TaxID=38727 RepID=UPI0019D662BF|nr:uncharacterized protein LOC120653665 [Panicum virgatum]